MNHHAYHRPRGLAEALALKSATPGSRFLAGGTNLLVQMDRRKLEIPALISLRGLDQLKPIEVNGGVRLGALTTLSELIAHPVLGERYPALVAAARAMGSVQIRNVATVAGNLVNASPAADLAPSLIALDARVELSSALGTRTVALTDFFVGPGRTALADDELLTAVLVAAPAPGSRAVYLRIGRVKKDPALASVAAARGPDGTVRLAAGAVAPVPMRLRAAEAVLGGEAPRAEAIVEAQRLAAAEVSPLTDIRASADYRRHLVGVLVGRALAELSENGQR